MTNPEQQDTFDVIVVGAGGSGFAAAIEARAQGRRVLLLEKNERVGGTTALSVGSISATNTPHQLKAGIQDSPGDHAADMPLFASIDQRMGQCGELAPPEPAHLHRLLADNVSDSIRWLMDKGVVFLGPMPELPHRRPRMHNVVPNSRAYIYHLHRHANRIGVEIRTGQPARRLITDNGRVVGVETQSDSGTRAYHARGGVILASGDYSADPAMKREYLPEPGPRVPPINPTNTGDGQRLGMELGARIVNGHVAFVSLRFPAPKKPSFVQNIPPYPWLMRFVAWGLAHLPPSLLRPFVLGYITTFLIPELKIFKTGAIMVNRDGQRFVDELGRPDTALLDQPGQLGYAIMSDDVAQQFRKWPNYISTAPGVAYAYLQDYRRNRPDLYTVDATLEGLARKLGIAPDKLRNTVDEYNAGAGLPGGARKPLVKGPFHVLGPIQNLMGYTEGGLAVNDRLEVLGAGDVPIPGLYAAGAAGQSGMMLMGHGHHLGWAFTSGRLAGREAAFHATTDTLPGADEARTRAQQGMNAAT